MDNGLKRKIQTASNQNSLILLTWLILGVTCQVVLYVVAMIFSYRIETDLLNQLYNLSAYIAQYVIAVPLAIIISKAVIKDGEAPKFRTAFRKPEATAGQLVRWLFICLFLIYGTALASQILFSIIEKITGIELNSIDMTTDESLLSRITSVLSMMILAPLFEESMFRVTIVRNGTRFENWGIIIISGITFGLWHCNYEQLFYAGVMGVCAGFLITKTKSVIPSLLLHFLMNTIGTVQSIGLGSIDQDKLNDMQYVMSNLGTVGMMVFASVLMYSSIIAGLILFIIELTSHKDTFVLGEPDPESREVTKAYLTAPVTIVMFVVFIAATLFRGLFVSE